MTQDIPGRPTINIIKRNKKMKKFIVLLCACLFAYINIVTCSVDSLVNHIHQNLKPPQITTYKHINANFTNKDLKIITKVTKSIPTISINVDSKFEKTSKIKKLIHSSFILHSSIQINNAKIKKALEELKDIFDFIVMIKKGI